MEQTNGSDAKGGWFVEAVRQITTPITLLALSLVCLSWIGSSISGASLIGEAFKGVLLLLLLVIFASIMGGAFWMAIKSPKHLTFDKEAHLRVSVDESPEDAAGILAVTKLLVGYAGNPEAIENLAKLIKIADKGEAVPTSPEPNSPVAENPSGQQSLP